MARPIPISNKKADQWNKFLVKFNEVAKSELPKDASGNPRWELLDTNQGWEGANYSGGQDFYQKKFNDFATSQGWNTPEDLQLNDVSTIQQLFTDIHGGAQSEPAFKQHFDTLFHNLQVDPTTFDPSKTTSNKSNTEGWVGSVSRNFILPMETGQFSKSKNKVLIVPKSFNQGETTKDAQGNNVPLYTDSPKFGAYYEGLEQGGPLKKGGDLSPEKAKIMLHEGVANGKKITDRQRRFFGAVASGYIKEEGGKLMCGGKMYEKGGKYEDGSDMDFEDEDIEAVRGGELEEISQDVVKVKGKDHDQGGVDLTTGDEVEGGETIDTKKEIVYSDTLIDPVTKKTFAKAHEEIARELKPWEKRFAKDGEKWVGKRVAKLKEQAEELYERQQEMNGGGGKKKEDGGPLDVVDPPTASDALKVKYYKVGDKEYTVRPGRLDKFLKEFPDAKEHDLVDGKLVAKSSPVVGQKKNTDVSTQANTSNQVEYDWDKIKSNLNKPDNPVGYDAPVLDVDEQATVDYFKERNNKISEYKTKFKDNYNEIIEPQIKENRQNIINDLTDPLGVFADNVENPEGTDLIESGARQARDLDNKVVINTIIPELKKKEAKFVDYSKLNEDEVVKENVENSEVFRNSLDNLKEKYKGIKLKRPDGTILDTDKITDSQWNEIRAGVINTYQVKTKWDENVLKVKTATQNALNDIGQNPLDPTAQFIKTQGIDKGLIPLSDDQWKTYFDATKKIGEKYTPMLSDLGQVIAKDNASYKASYDNDVAEFTHKVEPDILAKKTELETLVANQQLSQEDAEKQFEEFMAPIHQEETAIFEKWNKKQNQNSQLKLKAVEDSIHGELKDALKGTIFEKMDLSKVDSKYVEDSLNAFMELAGSFTENDLARSQKFLKDYKTKIYNYNDYAQQFGIEMRRGVLQMAEGIGGFISFLGGYEAGNEVNDVVAQFNQNNPRYETGHFEFSKLMNPDYWVSVVGPMAGQQLIMAPLALTGAGLGTQVAGKIGVGALGTAVTRGIGGAIMTRPINSMVNSGAYYNDLIANGVPTEEAAKKAADDFTFQMSLMGLDAIQIGAGFSPLGNIFKIGKLGSVTTKVIGGAATEGVEEVLEGYPERDDPFQTIFNYATSDVGVDQFTGGAMGGLVMGGVTSVPDLAARSTNNSQKFLENLTYDMMSGPDMGKRYEDLKLTIDTLLERKILTPKQYEQANRTLDFAYSKGKEIPANLPAPERHQILSYLSDINQLEQTKAATTDETLIKVYDNKIKELQKQVESTMDGKEPMYFIGRVPYSKEQFQELMQNPEIFQQVIDKQTTFDVINDDKVLKGVEDQIQKIHEQKGQETKIPDTGTAEELRGENESQGEVKGISDLIREHVRTIEEKQDRPLSREQVEDAEREFVFQHAKENNIWIDDITSLGTLTDMGGNENTIVVNPEEKAIYKSNNLFNSKNRIETLIDSVKYHNEIFPDTAYEIVGFTGIDKKGKGAPYVEPVIKQPFIENATQASPEEISNYMKSLGFEQVDETSFTNGEYTVSDLYPRNVLKDEEGGIYVVDDIVTKNEKSNQDIEVTEEKKDEGFNVEKVESRIEEINSKEPPVKEPPAEEVVAEKEPPEQKVSKFNKTIQNAEKVAETNKKTVTYQPKTVKELSDTANKAWKEIENSTASKEDAIALAEDAIKSREWKGDESEQAALAGIVAKELFDLRQQEGNTLEQINDYDNRAAELLDLVSKALTKSGQFSSRVGKFMAEVLMAYPEGITQHVQKTIDGLNDGSIPVNEVTVKTMEDIFNELLNNEEGKRILRDYAVREGLIKQKYKSKKEAVDAYLDKWLSTTNGGTLQSAPGPGAQLGDVLRVAVKFAAKTTLTIAEKVELTITKIKEKYKEKFDEAKLRAQLEHIFKDAEKFGDDWEKGKITKGESAVKTIKEKIEEEYQKRAKAVQDKLAKEKEAVDSDAKEINEAVRERLDADRSLREFEDGLKQLNGDKLKNLIEKVAKDFVSGKGKFTSEEIKRGIQQVNGGFSLSQRQLAIIDKSAKVILDINKQIKDNNNLTQQQKIMLGHQALQASSQIMKMLTKRNWLDILHGAKIAGYFTAKTLESNIVSNFVSRLFHKSMDLITSPIEILIEPATTRKGTYVQRVKERLGEKFGKERIETAKEEIKTIVPGLKIAYDIMKHGTPHGDLGKVPAQYDLKPIEAWRSWSEHVSKNPKALSKANEAAKIMFEGSIGFYSAFMLRSLGAGDVITRIPELAVIQKRMADYLNVPLNLFITDDQFKDWREDAEELSKIATYQQENLVLNLLGVAGKKIVGKNKSAEQARKVISTFLTSSIIPFTKTPANLASEVFKLIPGIAVPEFIWHTKQTYNKNLSESKRYYHQKLAQRNLKYTAISIPLFAAVKGLIEAGILNFPAPPEREKKKRGFIMNYAGSPGKMEINIPGMKKVTFDVQKFGPVGMYLRMVDETLKTKDSDKMLDMVAHMLESAPAGLLENTFFTGINNIMESLRNQQGETDWRKLAMDVFGPNTNIALPNILADFTKLMDDDKYVRLLKDEDFMTEFYNRHIRNKIGFLPFEGTKSEGLKPKYNVWGQPIKTDVEGQPNWFHYMFDFTRTEDVNPEEQEHFFIYKNYIKSKDTDWIPPIATKNFKHEYVVKEKGVNVKKTLQVKLTEDLVNEYQKVLGRAESESVNKLWDNQKDWPKDQVEPTLKQVKKAYDKAQEKAKKQFFTEYQPQLEKLTSKK